MLCKFRYRDGYEKMCSESEARILEKMQRGMIVAERSYMAAVEYASAENTPEVTVKRGRKKSDV